MAIYDTGTVTFSGTTVNGSGVNWQTANNPVRQGNTLLVMPANEAFTVVRINSATQLVVNRAPTKAISNSAYCLMLTDALSNDALAQRVSEMTRYYEQQVNAWGQLITASDDVSIVGPDGNAVKVPSVNKIYAGLNAKADKTDLTKKVDLIDVPFGAISIWPLATPPSGFAICDGRSFDKNAQPGLAKLFPTGKLPDFRGVFPRGFDADRGLNKGQGLLQYAADRLKRHKHMPSAAFIREMGAGASFTGDKQVFPIIGKSFASASYYNWGSNFDGSWPYMHSTFNNEPADETAPKSIAVNFIIRFA
ncbi:phage tail protein [Serratia ureilytica]|uniref:phage tail protein n=1 Tax=Serratia ureilytica TaxID=300181 RepID=UPI003712A635